MSSFYLSKQNPTSIFSHGLVLWVIDNKREGIFIPNACSGAFDLPGFNFIAFAALMLCFEGGGGKNVGVVPPAVKGISDCV